MKNIKLLFLLSFVCTLFIAGCASFAEKLSFENSDLELHIGDTYEVNPTILNIEGEVSIKYNVLDNEIVSIEGNVVTALKEGTTTVEAYLESKPEIKATLNIVVTEKPSIKVIGNKIVLVGKESKLSASIKGLTGDVTWESNDVTVVTVTDGVVKGLRTGTALVTVSCGGYKEVVTIQVVDKEEIRIYGSERVNIGSEIKLVENVVGATGEVKWSSSDETIATVEDGVVKGINPGQVTITVTCGNLSATHIVEVLTLVEITYDFAGGSSEELYLKNSPAAELTLNNYNTASGSFWGGGYSDYIYITDRNNDPGATFSDRIYIGKNQYSGYYEVLSILTSGSSSWAPGAEYVITISSSYKNSREASAQVSKLEVGDIVFIEKEISSINKDNPSSCKFYKPELEEFLLVSGKGEDSKLLDAVRVGFEFLGWYDESNNKVTTLAAITRSTTLTANWKELNPVTDITVNTVPTKMETENTFQIVASVQPADAFFKDVYYSTSNKDIVNVTKEGLLTAVNAGEATITVKDFLGKVVKTYNITVNSIASIDIKFEDSYNGVLAVNDTLQLEPSYLGEAVDGLSFAYASNNTSVATVDSTGLVKAIANGDVEITITTSNGKQLKIGITVAGLSEADKVDEVIKLLVENNFADVEVGNVCLYDDGNDRYYKATYGSVNRYLFDSLDINRQYEATAEANSGGHRDRRFSGGFDDTIEFVTVHDTATLTGSVTAIANNMSSGETSIHYTVGDKDVYSVVPEKYIAYHAGDGTGTPFVWKATGVTATENVEPEWDIIKEGNSYYFTINGQNTNIVVPTSNGGKVIAVPDKSYLSHLGPVWKIEDGQYYMGNTWVCFSQVARGVIGSFGGNNNSIGIEMCVNTGGDMYDTYQRTAKLVADILIRNNLDLTRVKQHNTWTGKNCPQAIIAGDYWDDFMKMVEIEYILAKDYKDVEISIESSHPEIVDNTGKVIKAPSVTTTVSYTVTVKCGSTTKTIKLYSVVPGSTGWEQWNGTYKASIIWNEGKFVLK